ncbi:MAG: L-threonylcarbamoyladenylate synthase [Brevinematia bacterium]
MKKTLLVSNPEIEKEKFDLAIQYLKDGGVVVFPTETVYGLGANAFDEKAVRKVFEIKGRPPDNPLIVHLYSIDMIEDVARELSPTARLLFERFSPGPLTVILPKSRNISGIVTGGLDTVAVRIPSHKIAREILGAFKLPIAAPSANISGRPSPTTFEMAVSEMNGRVDAIINGGDCIVGLESTVVKIEGEELQILRPGGISEEEIKKVLPEGFKVISATGIKSKRAESPGMKYTHYKPEADVILCEKEKIEKAISNFKGRRLGLILYRAEINPEGSEVIRFDSLEAYARGLYKSFYEMDKKGVEIIIAEKVEEKGIGKAIMNRLLKAGGEKR